MTTPLRNITNHTLLCCETFLVKQDYSGSDRHLNILSQKLNHGFVYFDGIFGFGEAVAFVF
jgi:hypothetical protein